MPPHNTQTVALTRGQSLNLRTGRVDPSMNVNQPDPRGIQTVPRDRTVDVATGLCRCHGAPVRITLFGGTRRLRLNRPNLFQDEVFTWQHARV